LVAQPRLFRTASQWTAIALCASLGIALFAFVDLTPEVEADFFFSTDDPQLQGFRRIEQDFGSAPQVFVAVRSRQLVSRNYLLRLRNLTEDLHRLKGVADVRSMTRGPVEPEEVAEGDPEEISRTSLKVPSGTVCSLRPIAPRRSSSCASGATRSSGLLPPARSIASSPRRR
jgi:predicted RND superfamily exporter protein